MSAHGKSIDRAKGVLHERIEARKQQKRTGIKMSDDLVVVARNPSEMQVAQQSLVAWAQQKVLESKAELSNAEENLTAAKKSKWRLRGFQDCVRVIKRKLVYYEKVLVALEAGYVIIPNLDLDIFAVRTTKAKPKRNAQTSYHQLHTSQLEQSSSCSPVGEGEYKNPWPILDSIASKRKNHAGTEVDCVRTWAHDWDDVDFPFKMVKPQIVSDTTNAIALNVFDQLGVTPHRNVRNQDPMIVGQIVYKGPGGSKLLSFLVTWWVDNKDLEV